MAYRILWLPRESKMVRHLAFADEICKMLKNSHVGAATITYCNSVISKHGKFSVSDFHMYAPASTPLYYVRMSQNNCRYQ